MFRISVETKMGPKTVLAAGPRRALWELRQLREKYGIQPTVSDDDRTYTEEELQQLWGEGSLE